MKMVRELYKLNGVDVWNYITINDMPSAFWKEFVQNSIDEFNGSFAMQMKFNYEYRTGTIDLINNLARQIEDLHSRIEVLENKSESFLNNKNDTVIKEELPKGSCFR